MTLPFGKFQPGHCKQGGHGGSSRSDLHSRLRPREDSIPRQSSSVHSHRRNSKWCSMDRSSSCHRQLVDSLVAKERVQDSVGSDPFSWDKMVPQQYRTFQWMS
ncbi:hypothetical protein GW17_00014969 [Ensete ventricosum]|nr:hypothetical protein GW17_00014969 [Ensete ventricosum]